MSGHESGSSFPGFAQAFADEEDDSFRSRFSKLFSPVYPYNRYAILTPFVSMAGAATIFVLTGVAAASLVVMSFALLVVVFLLTEVFGFEMAMPVMPGAPFGAQPR